jgi:hyperosmotically inducible periplasmic protein
MKNTFISFLFGVLVGIAGHWYYAQPDSKRTVADAQESMRSNAASIGKSLKETFDSDKIKDELARTGKVIREKAGKTGEALADAAANARSTATIKAKLLKESSLASLTIHVDTTDGVVTLSGTVPSHEAIAKAMELALETEGVQKVVSTLQVKSN